MNSKKHPFSHKVADSKASADKVFRVGKLYAAVQAYLGAHDLQNTLIQVLMIHIRSLFGHLSTDTKETIRNMCSAILSPTKHNNKASFGYNHNRHDELPEDDLIRFDWGASGCVPIE